MKKMCRFIMAAAALMCSAIPTFAQTTQFGPSQQRNSQQTTITETEIGPNGKPRQKTIVSNINLPEERKNPSGEIRYSGVPGMWMRQSKAEKVAQQEQKQVGP